MTRCGLCDHEITFETCGMANAYGVDLCHADDHSCYHRYTVYGERKEPMAISEETTLLLNDDEIELLLASLAASSFHMRDTARRVGARPSAEVWLKCAEECEDLIDLIKDYAEAEA